MKKIYLDNAATTQLDPGVIQEMNKAFGVFGNPSSLHSFGQEARELVDKGRDSVAEFLGCKTTEVIFTSGGSESDNLAIRGIVDSYYNSHPELAFDSTQALSIVERVSGSKVMGSRNKFGMTTLPHVITSAIEHHAVLHTVQDLEKEGKIEATYIKPDKSGIVSVKEIEAAIKDNTVLVSIMYVNNEVGTVQPIREVGKMLEARSKRQETITKRISSSKSKIPSSRSLNFTNFQLSTRNEKRIFFHCDAVQAAEWLPMNVDYLHVDLLTLTAHKLHGPKGVGILYVRKGTPIKPMITGGDHEFRLRAGTENAAAICGLAAALRQVTSYQLPVISKVAKLRDKLENSILETIPDTFLNGDKNSRAPHISNISFKNAEGEAIILNLDFLGIAVSSGSACTARSLEPSHVLSALGVPREHSHGAIRFSLSKYTTEKEIDQVIEVLPGIITKLRQMSPFS